MAEMTETGGQVVKFNITDAAINSLAEKYKDPKVPEGKDEYEALKAGIKEVSQVRIAIDKERKAQTAAALEHQRAVNKIGHSIINRLKDIEEPMKLCKAEVDEAAERKVREAEEAERLRLEGIHGRLGRIAEYGEVSINDTLEMVEKRLKRVEELDPVTGFDEFAAAAAKAKAASLESLTAAITHLTERAETERVQAEKQAELDRRAKELEEREAKAKAKQAELDAAEAKRKAEEQAEEQSRLRKLEDEQRSREAEEAARLQAEHAAAVAPDKEKLMLFADAIGALPRPSLESEKGKLVMAGVDKWLDAMVGDIKSEADRL